MNVTYWSPAELPSAASHSRRAVGCSAYQTQSPAPPASWTLTASDASDKSLQQQLWKSHERNCQQRQLRVWLQLSVAEVNAVRDTWTWQRDVVSDNSSLYLCQPSHLLWRLKTSKTKTLSSRTKTHESITDWSRLKKHNYSCNIVMCSHENDDLIIMIEI